MGDPPGGKGTDTSAPDSAWTREARGRGRGMNRGLNRRLRSPNPVRTKKAVAVTTASVRAWVCDPSLGPNPDRVRVRVGECAGGAGRGWSHHLGYGSTDCQKDGSQVRAQGPTRLGWDHDRSPVLSFFPDPGSGQTRLGSSLLLYLHCGLRGHPNSSSDGIGRDDSEWRRQRSGWELRRGPGARAPSGQHTLGPCPSVAPPKHAGGRTRPAGGAGSRRSVNGRGGNRGPGSEAGLA